MLTENFKYLIYSEVVSVCKNKTCYEMLIEST